MVNGTTGTPGDINNPLPADTTKVEPKVTAATVASGGVVLVFLTLCQLLNDNANLIAGLPDWLETVLLTIAASVVTGGAAYSAKHQYRRNALTNGR